MKNCGGFFEIDNRRALLTELEARTAKPDFWNNQTEAQKVSQQVADIRKLSELWSTFQRKFDDVKTLYNLAKEEGSSAYDQEIVNEINALSENVHRIELETKLSGPQDRNSAIVNLHSGAGGTEACDWVEMLFRMYLRWAERRGYATEVMDILPGDGAGIKSVTFFVNGLYAYGYLKSETGVHRLVRISPFDANKRRHTSFAACDVIPEIEDDVQIEVKDTDLRIDTYRSSGAGGQHVNKTDSAVRMTHLPTGIVVACQNERSQMKNRAKAMKMLKAKLFELEEDKKRAEQERHYGEKGDIAWGNQIRSYVFMPYQLVKDHRTDHEYSNIADVMDGNIDMFIESFLESKAGEKKG